MKKLIIAATTALLFNVTNAVAEDLSAGEIDALNEILDILEGSGETILTAACGTVEGPSCNGACQNADEVCKPEFGPRGRRGTGSNCKCMKKTEEAACGIEWQGICQHGYCPEGETCTSFVDRSSGLARNSCECKKNPPPPPPPPSTPGTGTGGAGTKPTAPVTPGSPPTILQYLQYLRILGL